MCILAFHEGNIHFRFCLGSGIRVLQVVCPFPVWIRRARLERSQNLCLQERMLDIHQATNDPILTDGPNAKRLVIQLSPPSCKASPRPSQSDSPQLYTARPSSSVFSPPFRKFSFSFSRTALLVSNPKNNIHRNQL